MTTFDCADGTEGEKRQGRTIVDLRAMFAWFTEPDAYRADFETTRQLDPQVLDLEQWVRASGFSAS